MFYILRFILIFILVVFLITFVFRLLFSYFIKHLGKKYGGYKYDEKEKKEGEVYVSRNPERDKVVDQNVGEYIDFEEVKDDD